MEKLHLNFLSNNKAVPDIVTGTALDRESADEATVEETIEELEHIVESADPADKKKGLKVNSDNVAVPEVNIELLSKKK